MNKKIFSALLALSFLFGLPILAFAQEAAKVDSGDTTLVLVASALVFFMTPGLALFYGGMVRRKNVLNTMMSSIVLIGLISVQWVLFGYSISFGPDLSGIIGNFDWFGFSGVGGAPNADYAATIPHNVFAIFQLMFAIITPAIIGGAVAERMRFSAYIIFVLLWGILVYDPMCHMVWAVGGFLRNLGALDFAGGTVVHISSGVSALVAALVIGKRKGYGKKPIIPHNIPLVLIGAGILWFGWFGFNTGCALSAGELAGLAFVNTNTAAAAALLSWMILEWMHRGKPTILGTLTGGIVGLVVITPAAGYVTTVSAIIMGLCVSPVCYFAITFLKKRLGYDDSLDAFGCHGVGGILGAITTGIFATKSVNPLGADGLLAGNPAQVGVQLLAVGITILWSGLATFIILKVISMFIKLKVSDKEEEEGLDYAMHGEEAYEKLSTEESIAI
ncbi:ammonium transporter [Pseudobacteroides cellulosolvens]|uniref:Ammonium transporter n=1 Tax=Pseudobacteroides cellulosolvens ATCC 35603 = DSM 2933 TaxID=398512 RepID=A0A0L6JRG9_9FIRM|nr:ammonium transporter [Pseudobacteroides cellulosolvens]KNY27992.1 ammonium transporter [Pseudobacteroides cellulosolvens ATCC 35603 = DSM 2933]